MARRKKCNYSGIKNGEWRGKEEEGWDSADVTEIGFNQSESRLFAGPREIAFVDKGPFWNFSFCSVEAAVMQNGNWLKPSKSPELEAFQAGDTLISDIQLMLKEESIYSILYALKWA